MIIKKEVQDVIHDSAKVEKPSRNYMASYHAFIEYFESIETIDKQAFLIGCSMAYSWMPRIPKIKVAQIDDCLPALNEFKRTGSISDNDLIKLISIINDSVVGTSKFLHFILPDMIPIWDRRVYYYLTEETPYAYRLKSIENFNLYRKFCNEIVLDSRLNHLVDATQEFTGQVTPLRSVEFVMYSMGQIPKNRKHSKG